MSSISYMAQPSPDCRRKFPRARANWPTRVVNAQKRVMNATCTNISEGGCQLEMSDHLRDGDKILMEFAAYLYTEKHKFKILGQITYQSLHAASGTYHYGVKFLTELGDDKQFVRKYVASHLN